VCDRGSRIAGHRDFGAGAGSRLDDRRTSPSRRACASARGRAYAIAARRSPYIAASVRACEIAARRSSNIAASARVCQLCTRTCVRDRRSTIAVDRGLGARVRDRGSTIVNIAASGRLRLCTSACVRDRDSMIAVPSCPREHAHARRCTSVCVRGAKRSNRSRSDHASTDRAAGRSRSAPTPRDGTCKPAREDRFPSTAVTLGSARLARARSSQQSARRGSSAQCPGSQPRFVSLGAARIARARPTCLCSATRR
jgi:hypothetical protein